MRLPPRPAPEERSSTFAELRAGWDYVRSTTWLWAVVLAFSVLNVIQFGAWNTLGPVQAKATFGPAGWGIVLSAQSVGVVVTTILLLERPLRRPLVSGMLGVSLFALPIFVLGWYPHVALLAIFAFVGGCGRRAVQPRLERRDAGERTGGHAFARLLLRHAGSVIAIPVGPLLFGPLGEAFGYRDVLVVSGVAYAVISLLTLGSRSVRDLRRVPACETAPVS